MNYIRPGEKSAGEDAVLNISPTPKAELSKAVMGMKFMKRKSSQDDSELPKKSLRVDSQSNGSLMKEETSNESLKALISNTSDYVAKSERIVTIDACVFTLNYGSSRKDINKYPGRRSFGGFNKAVERNYQELLDELKFVKISSSKSSKYDLNDEEMMERYKNLVSLPRGPDQGVKPNQKYTRKSL